ncbi:MAG: 3-oxoacid CoA-transferase subunit A [Firmicutes bacterium]|jgi:acetate CoA/acetoacetate CoA-transferase alpha subunit|nr:3-oxoacid CoA-transferase subunit A [Bacillota bacterium]
MKKLLEKDGILGLLEDGMTIMVGGFLGAGAPNRIMDLIAESDLKDLTLICNDTAFTEVGVGKLVVERKLKKVIASHIGTNKETGRQMNSGELIVDLVPQGTLAERVRAGGAGLGGILTETGVGTIVENGKEKITVDGKTFLLETPLKADVAIIFGNIVDKKGNVFYKGSDRNFNPLMAAAAKKVIVEADEIVEIGEIKAENIVTPSILVNHIVSGRQLDE